MAVLNKKDIATVLAEKLVGELLLCYPPLMEEKRKYNTITQQGQNKLEKDVNKFASNVEVQAIYRNAAKDLHTEWQKMFYKSD